MMKETTGLLSNRDAAWLEQACKLATTSQERFRHSAIIVLGGSVQSWGINKNTLDPAYHVNEPKISVHAEEAALKRAVRTKGAVIYVARINRTNEQRMSRPCDRCMRQLREAGIKRVVYTINCMEVL